MSTTIRHYLFITFVVLFFALSAIILPYALGYKFNLAGLNLQRTGMFDIKTNPNGAIIYLNDKKQNSLLSSITGQNSYAKTPVKLKNVSPGTYQVRLELDGYWPWEKRLVINPGETTYLEDVYLFKKNKPSLVETMALTDINDVKISPDHKEIAVLTKQELKIFAVDKIQPAQTISLPNTDKGVITWSPSGQLLAVNNMIINWRDSSINDLQKLGINNIDKLVWVDDNVIYFQEKNNLKRINLKTNELVITDLAKNLSDFFIKDNYIYLIHGRTEASLTAVKLNGEASEETEIIKLNSAETYRFINLGQDNINLQAVGSRKLYVVNTKTAWTKDYGVKEIGPLTAGQWVDNNKLILADNFELKLWTNEDDQTKLLTRISNPIAGIAWHKSNNYIVFATDKTINTLELDNRDTYNIATIYNVDKLEYPIFNRDGTSIFFWSTINNQSGFYWLEI